jgi:hypothetical protein
MKPVRILALMAGLVWLAPLAAASTIVDMSIVTSNPGGVWDPNSMAAIGITDPGGTGNLFYNDAVTSAIPAAGIPSGTYLLFLGYEGWWPGATGNTATLSVSYSDSTVKSATFLVGSITAPDMWTLISGDPTLSLGGGGFIDTPDRVGTNLNPSILPIDGVADVVLQFSDNNAVPEPGTMALLLGALLALPLIRRRLS